jgi:NADPH:quinone reductase-like Zn-dependent oxidoreductase
MKAVRLVAYGDASAGVALHDVEEPDAPGAGEALVRVLYAPINFNDLMVIWGIYAWKPQLPEILGNEGAGVVVFVGKGVTGLAPGNAVVLPFMARTWRERIVVRADQLTPLPRNADLQQAAMITINAVSAAMLFEDYVHLSPGDTIAYNAATSGLGHWVAGLASRRGLHTVGLVRRAEDMERVRQSGCDVVLLDEGDDVASDSQLAHMRIRLALDGVGGRSAGRLAELLSPDGVLVAYGAASGRPMEVSAQDLIFKRIIVRGVFEGHPDKSARISTTLFDLIDLLRPGGIRQPIASVYPVDELQEAMAHAVRGGKVLLFFPDPLVQQRAD